MVEEKGAVARCVQGTAELWGAAAGGGRGGRSEGPGGRGALLGAQAPVGIPPAGAEKAVVERWEMTVGTDWIAVGCPGGV